MLKMRCTTILIVGLISSSAIAADGGTDFRISKNPSTQPRQSLPLTSGPGRAYREARFKDCTGAPDGFCSIKFAKVADGKLLRIDRLDCFINGAGTGVI